METAPRRCGSCSRWSPPLAAELARWEAYQSGRTRRKARKPKGYCASIASNDPAWPGGTYCCTREANDAPCRNYAAAEAPGEPPGRP